MKVSKNPERYLRYIIPPALLRTHRTKQILTAHPIAAVKRKDAEHIQITVFDYNHNVLEERELETINDCFTFKGNGKVTWINVDGLRKKEVESICEHFGIHHLVAEDILSVNQRPKMDEVDDILYCLLNMLYFNEKEHVVEQEQVSIALGKDFVITFQEDPKKDVFNPIRERLRMANSKLRKSGADYLCYTMLDLIVDNYFFVMEKLGEKTEVLEEEVIRDSNKRALVHINQLRKELIVLKRNIAPVRDLIGGIIRSENELLDERTIKYFKDVHDHIIQAHDLSENYRDVIISMQDLYINNVNLRMNEVMKVMAIVTCLLAPPTVIGGIFGMNFKFIPTSGNQWGFYATVAVMLLIPAGMLMVFKRRGWF
ncbi:MAG: magnesium/cobalt transporter CorA [Chitinophagaceae bacterium]